MSLFGKFAALLVVVSAMVFGYQAYSASSADGNCCCGEACVCENCTCKCDESCEGCDDCGCECDCCTNE